MLVDNHELLVRVADKLNDQLGILLQKCKLKDMVTRIHGAINEANAKKAREIIETLKEQGILIKLGTFASREIENKVEELASIFPYSKEFLHVCRFSVNTTTIYLSWSFGSTDMIMKMLWPT